MWDPRSPIGREFPWGAWGRSERVRSRGAYSPREHPAVAGVEQSAPTPDVHGSSGYEGVIAGVNTGSKDWMALSPGLVRISVRRYCTRSAR